MSDDAVLTASDIADKLRSATAGQLFLVLFGTSTVLPLVVMAGRNPGTPFPAATIHNICALPQGCFNTINGISVVALLGNALFWYVVSRGLAGGYRRWRSMFADTSWKMAGSILAFIGVQAVSFLAVPLHATGLKQGGFVFSVGVPFSYLSATVRNGLESYSMDPGMVLLDGLLVAGGIFIIIVLDERWNTGQ